jgi:hypothetical protein
MLVATLGGPTMLARIGTLNRHVEWVFDPTPEPPQSSGRMRSGTNCGKFFGQVVAGVFVQ